MSHPSWHAWPPVGAIVAYAGPLCSEDASLGITIDTNQVQDELGMTGWLPCDGRSLLIADHFRLFGVIGFAFGQPDDQHFNLPDLRGRFVRGVNGTASLDPDAAQRSAAATGGNTGNKVGSVQADAFQGHEHDYLQAQGPAVPAQTGGAGAFTVNAQAITTGLEEMSPDGTPRSSSETRPVNLYLNHLIRCR